MLIVRGKTLLTAIIIILMAAILVNIIPSAPQATQQTATLTAPTRGAPKLIIDAGHGGADGGAVSLSGVKESEINLKIAVKLDQIAGFLGHSAIMTRSSEEISYSSNADTIHRKKSEDQRNRIALINSVPGAYLISIHQNKYTDGGPSGAECLYAPTGGSKEIAEHIQALLVREIDSSNRRAAKRIPKSIYLMNHVNCPAVLIECGFLSNAREEALLTSDGYQLKMAAAIAAGFFSSFTGGTNES
jgi:N-acetylmuramoyl-L-alanine amidase